MNADSATLPKYEGPVIVDAKLYRLYGPSGIISERPYTPIRPKSEWFEVAAPGP